MRHEFERALSRYFLVALTTQIAAILLTTITAISAWDQLRSKQMNSAISTTIEAQRSAISEALFVSEVLGLETNRKAPALRVVEELLSSQGFQGSMEVLTCNPENPGEGTYYFAVGERKLSLCVKFVATQLSWSAMFAVVAAIGLSCLLIAIITWQLLRGRVSERVMNPILTRMEHGARLRAIGELAAQLSHDIRSPLAALKVLANHLDGDHEVKQLALATIGRLEGIAKDLLDTRPPPQKVCIKVEPILNSLLSEKSTEHNRRFRLSFSAARDVSVRADPVLLTRALSNLINNAVEASPGESTVDLTVSRSRSLVSLTIRDRGRGFPRKVIERLETGDFESTKTNGNGLGLRGAYLFAMQSGGRLVLRNRSCYGAEATICLPAT